MKALAIGTLGLLLATASFAASGDATPRARSPLGAMDGHGMGGPLERDLFPPELVLSNQIALSLSADQIASIKKQVGDTHTRVLDVQVDLHRVTEQLNTALAGPKIDEDAVLRLASQAMDLEKQIKSAHLALMIRIKNLLSPDQQEKARSLTRERFKYVKKGGPRPEADRN